MRKALRIPRVPAACAAVVCLAVVAPDGAVQDPPTGRTVQAKDGDLILIDGGARVRLVRRREAQVQTIYNPAERWLIVMVDYAPAPGKPGDGGTDSPGRSWMSHR